MPAVVDAAAAAAKFLVAAWSAFSTAHPILAWVIRAGSFYSATRALSPKPRLSTLGGNTQVNVRDPAAPWRVIYGQREVAGIIYPLGTSGSNSEYLHLAVILAAHECDTLGAVKFDGTEVTLDGSGNATGKYAGYVRVKKLTGAYNQTVDTDTQTDLGSGFWTNNCRFQGRAVLLVRLKFSQDLMLTQIPNITCLVKGRKVYDPRDGTQDSSNPSTWKYSANAALCAADWLTGVMQKNSAGTVIQPIGLKCGWDEIDTTALTEAANTCDESVTLADSSTENRYEANGVIEVTAANPEILTALASAMAGDIVNIGGAWIIRAGAYRTPTVTLTIDDLRAPIANIDLQPQSDQLCNGVKGTYVSADNNWQPADFPGVKNDTYKTQDGGLRIWRDIVLTFTTSPSMAQRLAKIQLEDSRQASTFKWPGKLNCLQNQCTDVVLVTVAALGWSAKPFKVIACDLVQESDANGAPVLGCDLTLKETASGIYDWSAEETTVDLAPNTNLPNPFNVPTPSGLTLSSDSYRQNDGTYIPVLKVVWTAATNPYVANGGLVRIEYKKHADSTWIVWSELRGDAAVEYITAVVSGTAYDVRVQFQNALGARSNNNGAGSLNDYATSTNFTVTNDTTAPATPSGLAAAVGTGKSVRLVWTANTEPDLIGYKIYRNTVNNPSTATLLAFIAATTFVDVNVSLGTQYFYWITAVDASNNESAKSSGVNATPSGVATGATVSDPTAASKTAQGTYNASDGTVFSYLEFSLPALPSGAVGQNLLYRRNGDTQWVIASEFYNSGTATGVRIPDLSPNVSYDVATQAWNSFGDVSNVVAATISPFTAPTKTTAPADVASGSLSANAPAIKFDPSTIYFGVRAQWAANTDPDFDHYEIKCTATNTNGAIDYNWNTSAVQTTKETKFDFYRVTPVSGYIRVRAVNTSGVPSTNWLSLGDASGSCAVLFGSMALQDSTNVSVTGLKIGGGASASQQKVVYEDNIVTAAFTGGAPSEDFNIDLTNRGFSAKPDYGKIQCEDPNYTVTYLYSSGSSTSTNARCRIQSNDGSNIPASAARLFICFKDL